VTADSADALADLRAEAGRAVRDLGHALVGRDAAPDLLADVATSLDALTTRLETGTLRSRLPESAGESWRPAPPSGVLTSYDDRPVSGRSSPWGLDIEVHRHGDEVEALVVLRAAHEGAPGRSHGGIVAALFDDVFGFVLGLLEEPAFTGELGIRYVAPTPLHRRLACRCRLVERQGRKLLMGGELVDVEDPAHPVVVARGTATFITVDRTAFAQATAQRPAPADEDTGGA
jgi:acyl-coenzyme A thioesterase PaaI-like protein